MGEESRLINVVMVEDDASYTAVVRRVLKEEGAIQWCGSYVNPVRFLTELPTLSADVFLLDIHMPKLSGLECIGEIKQSLPQAHVIMISVHDDDDYVLKAFLEGADGYLLKDSTPEQVIGAIHEVQRGGAPMSSSIARKVISILGRTPSIPAPAKPATEDAPSVDVLTNRETEILKLLSRGRRYTEIATEICISLDTVKTHIRNIYRKLEVRNKVEAIALLLD